MLCFSRGRLLIKSVPFAPWQKRNLSDNSEQQNNLDETPFRQGGISNETEKVSGNENIMIYYFFNNILICLQRFSVFLLRFLLTSRHFNLNWREKKTLRIQSEPDIRTSSLNSNPNSGPKRDDEDFLINILISRWLGRKKDPLLASL